MACVCSGPQTISYVAFLLVTLNGYTCHHVNLSLLGRRRERGRGHEQSASDIAFLFADVFLSSVYHRPCGHLHGREAGRGGTSV